MRRRLIILIPALLALGLLAVSAEEPKRAESFTVVLLPDTQNYSENFPDNYVAQTLWIRKRLKDENIQFAIHLGDIVQNATQENGMGKHGQGDADSGWRRAVQHGARQSRYGNRRRES